MTDSYSIVNDVELRYSQRSNTKKLTVHDASRTVEFIKQIKITIHVAYNIINFELCLFDNPPGT